jgi:hypothetical protein
VGDAKNAAATLTSLGFVQQQQGNFALAGKFYDESLALWQSIGEGDTIAVAATLNGLSAVRQQHGRRVS